MSEYDSIVKLWQEKNISSAAELAEALNSYSINFAYNSGRIENENITYYDTKEIFERDKVSSYTGDLKTLFEIRNSKTAYELILKAFEKNRPLDEAFIKEIQMHLTQNTYDERRWQLGERSGEYKLHDYVTGRNEVGAAPEDVKEELSELLSELRNIKDKDILTAAAYFHAKFENIHPFADGNGRTGRLIMNYLLLIHNHPPVTVYEEDRREYYSALEAWDTRQELKPLIDFLKNQTEKTWGRLIVKK